MTAERDSLESSDMRLAVNFRRVDPSRGGAETYVADLCRALVGAGHRVDLFAESWRQEALPEGVNCVAVKAGGRTRLARLWSFARNSEEALRQVSYDCTIGLIGTWHHDVIIPQGGVQRGSLAANARRFPEGWPRALYTLGKKANPKFWVHEAIERRQYAAERHVKVIAVSNLVKEHLLQHHHVPRTRIHVIPNAIDPQRVVVSQPKAVRCAFRNRMGLEPGDLVGLFVGHNYRLKGLEPLLWALAERKWQQPRARPIHLLVCGGGAPWPARRLIDRLRLGSTVHLLGYYPDIRAAYWSSDFFVLPTFYDPCSLAVFEALACGLPVITTACNGASELLTDGREGTILTAPTARAELIQALDRMADDSVRAPMAAAALELGRAHTFDAHALKLIKVFEEVAAARSRRTPHAARFAKRGIARSSDRSDVPERG
jgi:UDP-glucose:(heptosyl)LPS alpha-1,3-glucosyltransferase